jgi:SRSO17 transposase
LTDYLEAIGSRLRDKRKRASFAMYAFGILGEGDRKSAEPIAARACGDPSLADAYHARVLHFLSDAEWDDRGVRLEAARHGISGMSEQAGEPPKVWIVDDTGLLKQGKHSVGVQRQYTGSAGKVANCQIAVSLSVATREEQLPIDMELYLPESWTSDLDRRKRAHIPESVTFKTKVALALDMIERACLSNVPGEIVLADSAYGDSSAFRAGLQLYHLDYAVGVHSPTKVFPLDPRGRRSRDAIGVAELARRLGPSAFRRTTWRESTSGRKLSARFCFRRVKVMHDDGSPLEEREPVWLVMEWRDHEPAPSMYYLTTLPRRMSKKEIVRIIKERWRTERAYEELKGELGFDHFEGRSYRGWHHHVSVVLACYAFVVAERVRRFSPSTSTTSTNHSKRRAA